MPGHPPRPWLIALTGMLSLAVAMGIGRFAFTPVLPMMLHDGSIDLQAGSWLATANYLGYWIGAMACALLPGLWGRAWPQRPFSLSGAVRLGLVLTVLLTLAMALPWPSGWALLRFAAGLASAVVFVFTSGWCLARLAAAGAPRLGGIIYVGPGLGIVISGLSASAMVALQGSAATAWMVFGALAMVLTGVVWRHLAAPAPAAATSTLQPGSSGGGLAMAVLVLAYGLAGFGYIISATFLPVMARQALPGSAWQDLFWPLFGLAVAVGALATTRLPPAWDRRLLLMGGYALQATGVLLAVWQPNLPGLAASSLLLGLPFTAISLFAMQEVRRVQPRSAPAYMGALTAAYGLGQVLGPALVGVLLQRHPDVRASFALSLQVAAAALLLGLVLFAWLVKAHPMRQAPAPDGN